MIYVTKFTLDNIPLTLTRPVIHLFLLQPSLHHRGCDELHNPAEVHLKPVSASNFITPGCRYHLTTTRTGMETSMEEYAPLHYRGPNEPSRLILPAPSVAAPRGASLFFLRE